MSLWTLILFASLPTQIPAPVTNRMTLDPLRGELRAILDEERSALRQLASRLHSEKKPDAAEAVRELVGPGTTADGGSLILPVQEIEPEAAKGDEPWPDEANRIRENAAGKLFQLATKLGTSKPSPHLALADECLRAVVARNRDHAEARRLLGQVPFHGGWATPFAAEQMKAGKTLHPVYGWVPRDWVPHLERGELPVQAGRVPGQEVWGTADEANARHSDWPNAWVINTEHFRIRTNVQLSEAISFGQRLETLHDVFEALFADVIGSSSSLARRFQDPKLVGERPSDPHLVSYFADRAQYVETLRPLESGIDESIGFYHPPTNSRMKRASAYFFRDPGNEIEATATLYHEVSHQLLFESGVAPPTAYTRNTGNFWVLEGLGTYFETLTPTGTEAVVIGGFHGPRIAVARSIFTSRRSIVPFREFVGYGKQAFNSRGDIRVNYQQAMAMTLFFMQADGGKFRDDFLAYVKDVCLGRMGRTAAPTLETRLGAPYETLETSFLDYLRTAGGMESKSEQAGAKPPSLSPSK